MALEFYLFRNLEVKGRNFSNLHLSFSFYLDCARAFRIIGATHWPLRRIGQTEDVIHHIPMWQVVRKKCPLNG